MNPAITHGAFSWAELQTADPEAAQTFYSRIFGWTPNTMEMETGPYTVMMNGSTPACGLMGLPHEDVPTNWSFYVTVDDVDEAVAKAKELGGSVFLEPMDIATVGRFAGIMDTEGAMISLIRYAEMEPDPDCPEPDFMDSFKTPGSFAWSELVTRDPEAAQTFYEGLFGWTMEVNMMGMAPYYVIKVGETRIAGMYQHPDESVPPHWGGYVTVEDADAVAASATAGGGTILMPPTDLPGVGRSTIIRDPQGATVTAIGWATSELREDG